MAPPTRRPREGGDPYAAAISRNCGVWIPGLAHARPGRHRHHTALLGEMAAHQHVVPAKAGTHAPQTISRNCRVWIPGLAHARPGRQRHHSALLSEMAAHQHVVPAKAGTHAPQPISRNCGGCIPGLVHARPGRRGRKSAVLGERAAHTHVIPTKAGTHTPQQYRETAEYGSRASLTLARDDSGTIVLSSAKWPHINTSSPRRRGPMLRSHRSAEREDTGVCFFDLASLI